MTSQNRAVLAQYARRALNLFRQQLAEGPVAIPRIQKSILAQLEWLTDFGEGHNEDRFRLWDLNFEVYLVKEETLLEDDGEIARAMYEAFSAASIYRRGLKIDSFMPPNDSVRTPEK